MVRELASQAHQLREQLSDTLRHRRDRSLTAAHTSLTEALARDVPYDETSDILAQAVVCAAAILADEVNGCVDPTAPSAVQWLLNSATAWERWALEKASELAIAGSFSPSLPLSHSHTSSAHLYDTFLHHYARPDRKHRGVFFTPQPIANFIVAQIDQLLRTDFALEGGLAHSAICNPQSALPFILDPATGTGLFLLAALGHIHRSLVNNWQNDGCDSSEIAFRWNAYAPSLLPRLIGIEILPAPALLAKLNITLQLAATGYTFHQPAPVHILLADALNPNTNSQILNLKSKIGAPANAGHLKSALPVLLGNPPFSSLSTNTNNWITRLVRGDDEVRGYIRANGQQLGERKTWLHDDYVKFIRLAQWHVEQAGTGLIGFVTNHGYLDNATFRLMRHELLRVFPHIRIIDLHGNRKKHEVSPDGTPDENIFHLDQGVAIGLYSRPPTLTRRVSEGTSDLPQQSRVEHTELWGSRELKLQTLSTTPEMLRASVLAPHSPDWRLVPSPAAKPHPEYESAWSLADAMPVNSTAPVTARDRFVIAFTEAELRQRIEEFRDLSIPDDRLRERYFTRTRSARHSPGDTRGWKLSRARKIIVADDNWQQHILPCLYRPFDHRLIFWHPALIDWPRTEVTRHLIDSHAGESATCNVKPGTWNYLCLIARRQQLPTHPCTFFWIADGLALDGVIRSDNRGSESLFPLYIRRSDSGLPECPHANFAPNFINHASQQLNLAWLPLARGDLDKTFGPEDLLAYIYALFHSPTYRDRYAHQLRAAFPRILIPSSQDLFASLCRCGRDLIGLHLAREIPSTGDHLTAAPALSTKYSVLSTFESSANHVTPADPLADFRVGTYPVLKKWLQPPHRSTADPHYLRIATAIAATIDLMKQIDESIAAHGDFPSAFIEREFAASLSAFATC